MLSEAGAGAIYLACGADVNAATFEQETALMLAAASRSDDEIVSMLIDAGANLNTRCDLGYTALTRLAKSPYGSISKAMLLVQRRADPTVKTNDGKTAALLATERGDVELAEYLRSVSPGN